MPALSAGITPPGQGDRDTVWNILGQTYYLKEVCDTSFAFEVVGEPGTFVPAHIHPTQDEFIYLIEGEMELTLDGRPHGLTTGGLARMPMGVRITKKERTTNSKPTPTTTPNTGSKSPLTAPANEASTPASSVENRAKTSPDWRFE